MHINCIFHNLHDARKASRRFQEYGMALSGLASAKVSYMYILRCSVLYCNGIVISQFESLSFKYNLDWTKSSLNVVAPD